MTSSARHDVAGTTAWVDAGTSVLLDRCAGLVDADFDAPSRLPGWSRREVVAHVARNAEALGRLLRWARTGQPTPMYADASQRAREISESARYDVTRLRRELTDTALALAERAAALDATEWAATVRSARGRDIPAAEVPWMRAREVWLHALDLDPSAGVEELPVPFSATLIEDVMEFFAGVESAPALRLIGTGTGRKWALGPPGAADEVRGSEAELAAWLTGRSSGDGLDGAALPHLPSWI